MNLKNKLDKNQIKSLLAIGINIDDRDYTDDEILKIDKQVTDYVMEKGFNSCYEPTELCLDLESVMDVFGEM